MILQASLDKTQVPVSGKDMNDHNISINLHKTLGNKRQHTKSNSRFWKWAQRLV